MACSGSSPKKVKERSNYDKFYEYVCHIACCSLENVGIYLQGLFVQWLLSICEDEVSKCKWF